MPRKPIGSTTDGMTGVDEYPKHRHHKTITQHGKHYLGGYRLVGDPDEEAELTPEEDGWRDLPSDLLEIDEVAADDPPVKTKRVKGPVSTD